MQKTRDLSFDAFRGLAIIAVVAIHATYLGGSPYSRGFLPYRQLLNAAVPALFFMSGYWSSKKPIKTLVDYKSFLTRRLSRILIPYLFWSFILFGYSFVKTGEIDGYRIIFNLLTGGACLGYYFVIAIAQLYIITPLLQYINRKLKWYGLILVLLFNLTIIFFLYLSRLFHVIRHIPMALPFYSWIIYYEIGLFMAESFYKILASPKTRLYILFAILASWGISVLEAVIILHKYENPRFASTAIKYSSLLYSVCVIFGFIFARGYFGHLPRLLGIIGHHSYGIYLIHVIILSQVIKISQKFSAICSFQPLYQFILVAATLCICLILIRAVRKLISASFCGIILGF